MAEVFCKLADPQGYVACPWDLTADASGRTYWVEFFKRHLAMILDLGVASAARRGDDQAVWLQRASDCRLEFFARFDAFQADPASHGRVTILTMDQWRDGILRRHGFVDAFADLKDRENAKVLPLLPHVCKELDELSGASQLQAIVRGVFAGNLFDMGSDAVAKNYLDAGHDFHETRLSIHPRPWLIDDYDAFERRMLDGPPHRKAVFFVDNAGSDFLLGAIPMMRALAMRGTHVVLAANQRPTLNDMTLDDVRTWWPRITQAEPSLLGLPIQPVSTGTGEPLIDLSQISPDLNAAAQDADLVILEGMGRSVESNLDAAFSCDSLKLAMIKDQAVADRHGGKLFDCVCRFARTVSSLSFLAPGP
jgi:damage-control phosphatase, subfamily II, stand-alone protein